MRYLAVKCGWGRLGHQFKDLVSGLLVAEAHGLQYCNLHGFCDTKSIGATSISEQANIAKYNPFFNIGAGLPGYYGIKSGTVIYSFASDTHSPNRWICEYPLINSFINFIPDNSVIMLCDSSRVSAATIRKTNPQAAGKVQKMLQQWIAQSLLARTTQWYFDDDERINVAVMLRARGKYNDIKTPDFTFHLRALTTVIEYYKNVNVKVFSNGPLEDISQFSDHSIIITEDDFPSVYRVLKSLIQADIVIASYSALVYLISVYSKGIVVMLNRNNASWAITYDDSRVYDLTQLPSTEQILANRQNCRYF